MYFYDWTIILLIPALILTFYAQMKVKGSYNKFSKVRTNCGLTGAQVARKILDQHGLFDVRIEQTSGMLSDHYDPRSQTVRLSPEIYSESTIAAVAVAAHETGHAVQHADEYTPLKMRSAFVPLASFGSNAGPILLIIGLVLGAGGGVFSWLITLGIYLFAFSVLFQVITLPVEFNASNRAMNYLEANGVLGGDQEIPQARKMLNAAALTYVAAALVAILTLIRFILMSRRD